MTELSSEVKRYLYRAYKVLDINEYAEKGKKTVFFKAIDRLMSNRTVSY